MPCAPARRADDLLRGACAARRPLRSKRSPCRYFPQHGRGIRVITAGGAFAVLHGGSEPLRGKVAVSLPSRCHRAKDEISAWKLAGLLVWPRAMDDSLGTAR